RGRARSSRPRRPPGPACAAAWPSACWDAGATWPEASWPSRPRSCWGPQKRRLGPSQNPLGKGGKRAGQGGASLLPGLQQADPQALLGLGLGHGVAVEPQLPVGSDVRAVKADDGGGVAPPGLRPGAGLALAARQPPAGLLAGGADELS